MECGRGHRHWGRYGAAGLLLRTLDEPGEVRVLLQHRAAWSADGDTWGIPGGARDSAEAWVAAALREAAEETRVDTCAVRVRGTSEDDHGGWSYVTVLADTPTPLPVTPDHESADLAWVAEREVEALRLHPGFAATWPQLRARPITLVVDAANVVGSRPDGWWRDRAAATDRLRRDLEHLRAAVIRVLVVVRRVALVVEGAARNVATPPDAWVEVVVADGSGDDSIVATAQRGRDDGEDPVVVTADRELRARARVAALGPSWLLAALERDWST